MRQLSTAKIDGQSSDETWTVLQEKALLSTPLGVTVTEQTVRLPSGTLVTDYLQINMPHFTTVLPVTHDGYIVCIRQYKHGVGNIVLTLPGGAIEQGEAPMESARRELLEETGYQCAHWQSLGEFIVGANQGIGTSHLFLARSGRRVCEANSGDLEDMEIELLAIEQLKQAQSAGEFPILSHACAIALSSSLL